MADRAPGTLKRAYQDLVGACGGLNQAARLVRVSPAQLHRYTDAYGDHARVHMPADIVLALEAHCGRPVVTGWLAQASGYRLVARERAGGPALRDLVSASIDATAVLTKTSLASLAAGTVTAAQAGRIRHDALRAIDALSAIHDAAARIQEGDCDAR